jgi:hypothetical protein
MATRLQRYDVLRMRFNLEDFIDNLEGRRHDARDLRDPALQEVPSVRARSPRYLWLSESAILRSISPSRP